METDRKFYLVAEGRTRRYKGREMNERKLYEAIQGDETMGKGMTRCIAEESRISEEMHEASVTCRSCESHVVALSEDRGNIAKEIETDGEREKARVKQNTRRRV